MGSLGRKERFIIEDTRNVRFMTVFMRIFPASFANHFGYYSMRALNILPLLARKRICKFYDFELLRPDR